MTIHRVFDGGLLLRKISVQGTPVDADFLTVLGQLIFLALIALRKIWVYFCFKVFHLIAFISHLNHFSFTESKNCVFVWNLEQLASNVILSFSLKAESKTNKVMHFLGSNTTKENKNYQDKNTQLSVSYWQH